MGKRLDSIWGADGLHVLIGLMLAAFVLGVVFGLGAYVWIL